MKRLLIYLGVGILSASILTGCGGKIDNYYKDGMSYFEKSDYSKAVECFQKAVEMDSENSEYMVYLGMSLLETGDSLGAVNTFMAVLEKDETNRDAIRGLGIAYMRDEVYDEAIKNFAKVEEYSDKADGIYLDAMKYRAECCYEIGKYNDAIAIYDNIIGKVDKSQKYFMYYLRGRAYVAIKDENSAVLNFEESLKLKGNDYELCSNMYFCFKEAGFVERGESYIKRVMQSDDISQYDKGKFYFVMEDYAQAEGIFTIAYDEGNVEAAYYLAKVYEAQSQLDKAEKLYKDILLRYHDDYRVYNQYGVYLINRKDYVSALGYIDKGLTLAKGDEAKELLYNQAVCYEFMYEYKKAYELFSDYLKKYPTDEQARKELEFLSSR